MIKKIIACADVHIRQLKRHDEAFEVLSNFIEQVKSEMEGYSPEEVRIVVAGDIFESKITVSNEGNVAVAWFLNQLDSLATTIVIAGNHDYLQSNLERLDSLTPIFSLCNFKNTIFLDKELEYSSGCYQDDGIIWCLYSTFIGFDRPDIEEAKKIYPEYTFVGLVHGDINGAKTDRQFETTNGLEKSIFKGLDFVIAGHIHKHQELKQGRVKIVYCGSIIQQNFGENVENHGYVVWDVATKKYAFKETPNPNYGFYQFAIKDIEDIKEDREKPINFIPNLEVSEN